MGSGEQAKLSRTLTEEREECCVGRQVPLRLYALSAASSATATAAFKGREATWSPVGRYGPITECVFRQPRACWR